MLRLTRHALAFWGWFLGGRGLRFRRLSSRCIDDHLLLNTVAKRSRYNLRHRILSRRLCCCGGLGLDWFRNLRSGAQHVGGRCLVHDLHGIFVVAHDVRLNLFSVVAETLEHVTEQTTSETRRTTRPHHVLTEVLPVVLFRQRRLSAL